MGYMVALVPGVIIAFMGIIGLIARGLGCAPGDGRLGDPGPLVPLIPLTIGVVLIVIGVVGLRKRTRW